MNLTHGNNLHAFSHGSTECLFIAACLKIIAWFQSESHPAFSTQVSLLSSV